MLTAGLCLLGCGEPGDEADKKSEVAAYYDFEEVVAALQGTRGAARYLRVTFKFEIDHAKQDQAVEAIKDNRRAIRDGMIVFLSTLSIETLNEEQTLDRIRKEVREITNKHLGEPFVRRVLLDKFAVQ